MQKIHLYDKILFPLVTEKSTNMSEQNKVSFKVPSGANKKNLKKNIEKIFKVNVIKINIITGKGLRSKNLNDPYQSIDLSILKHSVPNYIKDSPHLMSKIIKIDQQAVDSPSKGNFEIFLKKKL